MTPDPDRKPIRQEMRAGGMVALAALIVLAVLTVIVVVMG